MLNDRLMSVTLLGVIVGGYLGLLGCMIANHKNSNKAKEVVLTQIAARPEDAAQALEVYDARVKAYSALQFGCTTGAALLGGALSYTFARKELQKQKDRDILYI